MFILSTISDVIQIEPTDFRKTSAQALEDNINQKYANKVISTCLLAGKIRDLTQAQDNPTSRTVYLLLRSNQRYGWIDWESGWPCERQWCIKFSHSVRTRVMMSKH